MDGFNPTQYGARWAATYDDFHEGVVDSAATVAGLHALAGERSSVLEYGAGTGRIAIPLAQLGHAVTAVEISEEMLEVLARKVGSANVEAVRGDMTTVELGRDFDMAFVAFNSIFALSTQQDQVRLFRNAAKHLRPGGAFALETVVVETPRGNGHVQRLRVADVRPDELVLAAGLLDPVTQFYNGTWAVLGTSGTTFYPIQGRHVTHAEMDLMAQLADLELESRWQDWQQSPFTAESHSIVTVYRKPG
ncbi:class I SAM-dependent methyltransferase [Actinomycetes bacterium KLBMP 9759]